MELKISGPVPERVLKKAHNIINTVQLQRGVGWKKVNRMSGWYSYRLNIKYRLLCSTSGSIYVCKHEMYEKKIRKLQSQ